MGRELRRVDARVYRKCKKRGLRFGIPDLDGTIPTATQESRLVAEIPVDREDLSAVFRPAGNGELAEIDVEEFDATISAGSQELILVGFRPSCVEQTVLSLEELLADNAAVRQVEDEEAAIAYQTEVGTSAYTQPTVEEGRVLDGVRVEACRPKLEHG